MGLFAAVKRPAALHYGRLKLPKQADVAYVDTPAFHANPMNRSIRRHKAAIRRHEHSVPVKCLLRDQLVTADRGVFDYGCGHGDDLAGLAAEGIECGGFDPAFRPDAAKVAAPVVNLGFVLNVIEDVDERAATLREAWGLAEQVLCVAARIIVSDQSGGDVEYGDGVLTRIGTFQKYFTQAELRQYIEETLGVDCFPAAPGVFYVFRDDELKAAYLASKYRRRIAAPRKRIAEIRYEEHREILDALIESITELGRLPEPDEFAMAEPVTEAFGSLKRAFALIRRVTSDDDWETVRKQRSEDLLVYLALANFGKRPKLSELSRKFQRDVKAFFVSYKNACSEADSLMFRAGDPDEIDAACQRSLVGRLCPSSLWIHEDVRDQLEPLLRIYEGCARAYIGSVEDANLIKLHRFSGKVSYLACPDFEAAPHPITTDTTKVWLRKLRVGFYETHDRLNPPLLDCKDQMLDAEDDRRAKFSRLTRQEFKHGLLKSGDDFLTQTAWQSNLKMLGFEHRGHRLIRKVDEPSPAKVNLPRRCPKHGVGKRIGGAVYVHRDYENVLGDAMTAAKACLPLDYQYTVIKHNETNGNFSFIHCPDFDTTHEPATGDYAVVKSDGAVKLNAGLDDPYIYHHKWLFVAEDYAGFDVAASVQRSIAWMSLSDVDKSLIGRASYWNSRVVPRLANLDARCRVTTCPQTPAWERVVRHEIEDAKMRKLATIRTVTETRPIDGADLIELAVVDGWKCVTKKGEYAAGDAVIYCEIDSFLPVREEFEFLRKSSLKTMDDREGFRLRTVKLRGQISQGLLLDPSILGREYSLAEDVTEELGIVKYEAPIPACLDGDVVGGFPAFIAKTDEERIQNLASDFDSYRDRAFYVSEKIDGTSFTAFVKDGEFGVCGRNWQLAEDATNSHWRVVRALDLQARLERLGRFLAVQGQLVGPGIQKNRYGLKEPTVFVFNVYDIEASAYVEKSEMEAICRELDLSIVPPLGEMTIPDSLDAMLELAEGKSVLNPKTQREGLVWVSGSGDDRVSFKTISNKFLAKHGD